MRKKTIYTLLLGILLFSSSCIRVSVEARTLGRIPPQKGVYCGTKFILTLPRELAMGLGVSGGGGSVLIGCAVLGLATPLYFIDIPLEVAMDTICLPIDAIRYGYYNMNPPLDKYLYDDNVNMLEKKLHDGADPNAIPTWFMKKEPLIKTAYMQNKEDIFEFLLKYGAKVPGRIFTSKTVDEHKLHMQMAAIACNAHAEVIESPDAKYYVTNLLKCLENEDRATENDKVFAEHVIMLLELGLSPNDKDERSGLWAMGKSALDLVLKNKAMETGAKDRLVKALVAHGAKSYSEIHNQKPEEKCLHIENVAIHPAFQPVIDILKSSDNAELFRVSDKFEDVDGPVLVIEHPNVDGNKRIYRKKMPYRRRISQTEWSENDEFFDGSAYYQMVLTPRGRRLPSRRPQGMLAERVFWEAWYTLPTCELYIEHAMQCGNLPDRDLLKVCLLSLNLKDDREMLRQLIYKPSEVDQEIRNLFEWPMARSYSDGSFIDWLRWRGDIEMSPHELEWQSKVNAELAKSGIDANWIQAFGSGMYTHYAFSTHRELSKTPLVPHPEEVIVIVRVLGTDNKQPEGDFQMSREGKGYWNYSVRRYACKIKSRHFKGTIHKCIYLYYGDLVPDARLEDIRKALEMYIDEI